MSPPFMRDDADTLPPEYSMGPSTVVPAPAASRG